MSVSTAKSLAFLDQAHGDARDRALSGTPASISASEPPQTVAIELEPLDSVMSETTRIVYGNSRARQHRRSDARPAAVADFAPAGAPKRPTSPTEERREVIIQHEALVGETFQPIDHLLQLLGAERGGADRLSLAACEQRRAVGARQEADDRLDRAYRLRVATVDATAVLEDRAADDVGLERFHELGSDELLLRVAFGECFGGLGAGSIQRGRALGLVGELVGGVDILADEILELFLDRALVGGGRKLPGLLGGLLGKLDDRLDHLLALAVSEHYGAQHLFFGKLLRLGFDHHHGVAGASDDEVERAFRNFGLVGVELVLAVLEPDASPGDRPHERNARQRQSSRSCDHRQNIRLVLAVIAKNLSNNENLVIESFREQRPNWAVDEAAGQRFLFGRAALTLEEAARDSAGSGEFFLVVDGQWEEILSRLDRLGGGNCAQHHGFAEGREHRTVGLAGNSARFELEGFSAPLDFNCLRIEHVFSFTPRAGCRRDSSGRRSRSASGSGP